MFVERFNFTRWTDEKQHSQPSLLKIFNNSLLKKTSKSSTRPTSSFYETIYEKMKVILRKRDYIHNLNTCKRNQKRHFMINERWRSSFIKAITAIVLTIIYLTTIYSAVVYSITIYLITIYSATDLILSFSITLSCFIGEYNSFFFLIA